MALVVEDGHGLSNADAYISVVDFLAYHVDMNNTSAASLTNAQIEANIRYATIWMDARYRWRGDVVEDDQSLGMPTENGYDDQGREIIGLPIKVANACAELALMHYTYPLNAVLSPRVIEQEVVGAVRRKFADSSGNEGNRFPIIDQMLKGLYNSGALQFVESMGA